jgi:hypothetical protein
MRYMKRMRDLAIETLIATLLVSAYVAYFFMRPRDDSSADWQRITEVVNTMIVFGFVILWSRHAWRTFLFWTVVTILLVGHVQHVPTGYYVLLNAIELALFSKILNKLPGKPTSQSSTEMRS